MGRLDARVHLVEADEQRPVGLTCQHREKVEVAAGLSKVPTIQEPCT